MGPPLDGLRGDRLPSRAKPLLHLTDESMLAAPTRLTNARGTETVLESAR